MNLEYSMVAALASLCVSLLTLAKLIFGVTSTIAAIQVKVDTMWAFTLRRGTGEAVMQGFATINSPVVFTVKAKEIIAPMIQTLEMLYNEMKPIADDDLAIEIEQAFGDKLLQDICIPNKMSMGACLVIAVAAAKGKLNGADLELDCSHYN